MSAFHEIKSDIAEQAWRVWSSLWLVPYHVIGLTALIAVAVGLFIGALCLKAASAFARLREAFGAAND